MLLTRIEDLSFEKVTYYSVRNQDTDEDETEFHDFLQRMSQKPELEDELGNLFIWIEEIGRKYGAKKRYFRHEGKGGETSALPPPKGEMVARNIDAGYLRLYCLVANEHVVILFNGDVKTAATPQECPNLRSHFLNANAFAKKIDQCFRNKEITWNTDQTDIEFDSDLEIEL